MLDRSASHAKARYPVSMRVLHWLWAVLNVAGAIKHRPTDKGGDSDVLSRMV